MLDLQEAVHTLLDTNKASIGPTGVTEIRDRVPEKEAFPYVTIGDHSHEDRSSHNTLGWTTTLTIRSWSRAESRSESFEILNDIETLINPNKLTVANHNVISLRRGTKAVLEDPDSVTFNGVITFDILLGEKT